MPKKLKFRVGQIVQGANDPNYKATIIETNAVDLNGLKFDYKDSYDNYWPESALRPLLINNQELRCDKTMCHDPKCQDCYPKGNSVHIPPKTPYEQAVERDKSRGYCSQCGDSIPECKCQSTAPSVELVPTRSKVVKLMQNHFRKNPKLKHLVKHIPGGLELTWYYLNVLEAIDKVPSPIGVENEFVIRNTNKKRLNELKVVDWVFNVALQAAMTVNKTEKRKKRVSTSKHSARS